MSLSENILNSYKKDTVLYELIKQKTLENSVFKINNNYIFYILTEKNKIVSDFINNHLDEIRQKFNKVGKKFISIPSLSEPQNINSIIDYYFPEINYVDEIDSDKVDYNHYFLDYISYKGNIKNAFISIDQGVINIIDINFQTEETIKIFIEEYCNAFHSWREYMCLQPTWLNENENREESKIELDEDTYHKIKNIIQSLNNIKDNGQFITILPILENYIKKNKQILTTNNISSLFIDENYKIFLPEFNNREIKIASLTKAIYFLFLMENRGIDLKELKKYRSKLLIIYKNISNQNNYSKLIESVQYIISDENAIYVHLSRIKSAFCNQFDESIAKNYFITGKKFQPKQILLDRNLTNIQFLILSWFPINKEESSPTQLANEREAMDL